MTRKLVIGGLLYGVWLLWSGHTEVLLLSLGVASCVLVVILGTRLKLLDNEGYPLSIGPRLVLYVPWVLWQIVLANIATAKAILQPKRVHSHLIHVPVGQRTVIGQVIHANTITITPGTVSLDLRDHRILVHALTDDAASDESASTLDDRVNWLEKPARHTQGKRR